MKKKTSVLGRMIALLLAVPLMIGLAPLPAHAVSAAHFTDVPSSHWAYQYVEQAYKDHAILGMGGEPEMGTGIFRPNDSMTYGQFLTMLTRAFYPKERERVGEDGPWYAPALQVAVNRQLNFNTLESLEHMVDTPINRYNAAWILVRILEDKGVVLPTDQERAVAAAQIGDWDTLLEDEYWRYFVSSIYALGIITGVDQSGAFHGTDYITRASAAVLYTKMADKVQRSGNDPKAFGITFEGDWSAASKEYREALEEEFYTVYPRLWARFGTANTARHISLFLVPREEIDGNDGITYTGFDDTKYETTASIKIANVYLDDWRHTAAIFAHELTHAATGVTLREIKSERLKSGNGVMENFRVGQAAFQRGLESLQHSITPLPDYSHLKITTGSLSAWLIMGSSATRPGRTRGICGSRNLIISRKTKPCALGSMRRTRIRTGFSPT